MKIFFIQTNFFSYKIIKKITKLKILHSKNFRKTKNWKIEKKKNIKIYFVKNQ